MKTSLLYSILKDNTGKLAVVVRADLGADCARKEWHASTNVAKTRNQVQYHREMMTLDDRMKIELRTTGN